DRMFIMNTGDQAFGRGEQPSYVGCLVDAATLGFDDEILALIAHSETVAAADAIGLEHHLDGILEGDSVQRDRLPLIELNRDLLALDDDVIPQKGDAHDGFDDLDSRV